MCHLNIGKSISTGPVGLSLKHPTYFGPHYVLVKLFYMYSRLCISFWTFLRLVSQGFQTGDDVRVAGPCIIHERSNDKQLSIYASPFCPDSRKRNTKRGSKLTKSYSYIIELPNFFKKIGRRRGVFSRPFFFLSTELERIEQEGVTRFVCTGRTVSVRFFVQTTKY